MTEAEFENPHPSQFLLLPGIRSTSSSPCVTETVSRLEGGSLSFEVEGIDAEVIGTVTSTADKLYDAREEWMRFEPLEVGRGTLVAGMRNDVVAELSFQIISPSDVDRAKIVVEDETLRWTQVLIRIDAGVGEAPVYQPQCERTASPDQGVELSARRSHRLSMKVERAGPSEAQLQSWRNGDNNDAPVFGMKFQEGGRGSPRVGVEIVSVALR